MHDRGKKITCPGGRDKLNFRQDKHKFSPNVQRGQVRNSVQVYFSLNTWYPTIHFGQVIWRQDEYKY